jgi:hypothetical protein
MSASFSRGLIRDDGRHKRAPFDQLRGRLGATPSGGADLSPHLPPVLDQNRVGSCVMNGVPCAAFTTLSAKGEPLGFVPSVRGGYQIALALDRAQDHPLKPASELPPLRDRGTQILTGVRVVSRYGVTPMGQFVIVDGYERFSDCSPENATDEPDLDTVERAATHLLVGAYELGGRTLERDVQLTLDAGIGVAIGNFVDTLTFEPYGPTSPPIGAQDLFDLDGGGHCTFLHGYRTDAAGVTIYEGTNSWSERWGREGRYQCTGAFLRQAWEAFAIDVEVRP